MTRILLLLGLALAAWITLRRRVRQLASTPGPVPLWFLLLRAVVAATAPAAPARRAAGPSRREPLAAGRLVRCAACGVYFPEERAVERRASEAWCSEACASAVELRRSGGSAVAG